MTALLTADEAARLRPGEQLLIVRAGDEAFPLYQVYHAPQDWVALTGPCPDKFCRNGEVQYPEWEGEVRKCESCRDGRRIVPLYTECLRQGYLLVGRGSIEVVPVLHWQDNDEESPSCLSVGHGDPNGDGSQVAFLNLGFSHWPVRLDPLPVPGKDFGIVIDVVEVAR